MADNHPMAVRQISITIDCPFAKAYAFTQRPENFPRWAAGLSRSLHKDGDIWHADTPAGDAVVTFSPANEFGILDHRVSIAGQPEIYIPLRMIENGAGTTVLFTLFRQPEMDDAAFEADATLVQADLDTLKALLEARH